jgi:hypothetical protein
VLSRFSGDDLLYGSSRPKNLRNGEQMARIRLLLLVLALAVMMPQDSCRL